MSTLMMSGLKVLDLTNNIAGPVCAAMLGDHGAEVIHIEKPVYGDDCRSFPPIIDGTSTTHMFVNRNKRSVVLDLKDKNAVSALLEHAKDCDVFIESCRPGVMARLGLDYDTISRLNPRVIYCSISAYGQNGPYAGKAGYDIIAQGFSGMMYYSGEKDGEPTKCGTAVGDFVGAVNAFGSIAAALYYRQLSGIGQHIDVSLARGLLWMTGCFDHLYTGVHRTRTGSHDASLCPYGIFRNGRGGSVVIGAVNVLLWKKLCLAMGRQELMDGPRFVTNDQCVKNSAEVIKIIEDWLGSLGSIEEAVKLLDEYGVPNTNVNSMEDILQDPHVKAVGWLKGIPVPPSVSTIESRLTPVGIAGFSETDIRTCCAPDLGEDTAAFLEAAGMRPDTVDSCLEKWGVPKGSD